MAKKRVLVTGFTGGWPSAAGKIVAEKGNVSELVINMLANMSWWREGGVELRTVISRVCWKEMYERLHYCLDRYPPDFILNLGHHSLIFGIQLESVVYNFRAHPDADMKDAEGNVVDPKEDAEKLLSAGFIREGGNPYYRPRLGIGKMVGRITSLYEGRMPIYIHDTRRLNIGNDFENVHSAIGCPHGLDYLCNYSAYLSANWMNRNFPESFFADQLLIHLPPSDHLDPLYSVHAIQYIFDHWLETD